MYYRYLWPMQNQSDNFKFRRSFLVSEGNCISRVYQDDPGALRMKLLDQRVFSFHQAITFHRHSFFYSSFNKKIKQLKPSGVVNMLQYKIYKAEKMLDQYRIKNSQKLEEKPPVVLTMDHLTIGFLIWIALLLMAFCIFVINFIIFWWPKIWRVLWLRCALQCYYKKVINH